MSDEWSEPEPGRRLRRLEDLPMPAGLPWLGQATRIDPQQAHLQFEAWARALGTPYRLRLGSRNVVVWSDPEVLQQALRERPGQFARAGRMSNILAEMGIDGLFAAEGDAWEPQRRLVMQALNPSHTGVFFPTLQAITKRLYRHWCRAAETGATVDMVQDLMGYTVDVTCALAFGEDPNTLEQGKDRIQQQLGVIFPMLMRRMIAPVAYWRWIRLPRDRALDRALLEVHAYVDRLIVKARERMRRDPSPTPRHLLEALLVARDQPNSGISDHTVAANVLTMLLAGEDTTANSMAWVIPFLAADAALQDTLHAQAVEVLQASPVCAHVNDLPGLDVFEALAHEAQRLHPVIGLLGFTPVRDSNVGGVNVPAGVLNYYLHRPAMVDARNFHAPERFDPQRWLRHRASGAASAACPHNARAFLQFGAGPRVCPGRHLAGVEIRLVMSMLLRHFKVELACDPGSIREVYAFTVTPSHMPVRLTRRL